MAAKKKTSRKVTKVDFDDEESVLRAMSKELSDEGALSISQSHMSRFPGVGEFYSIKGSGHREWVVARNHDEARELAIAVVTQDLENEPEIFNSDFIESHINIEQLRRDLMSDVQNMRYEDLKEEADRRPMKFLKDNNLDIPEPTEAQLRGHAESMSDEEKSAADIYRELKEMGDAEDRWIELGDDPEVEDSDIEEIAEKEAEAQLKDPIDYLSDIYGKEDAVKKAIEMAGIDIEAAAEEAVDTDGAEHFLARYDGYMHDGPDGIVYWRDN